MNILNLVLEEAYSDRNFQSNMSFKNKVRKVAKIKFHIYRLKMLFFA